MTETLAHDTTDETPTLITRESVESIELTNAVREALTAEPLVCRDPVLFRPDYEEHEHVIAHFTASWEELPYIEEGIPMGWLPEYRSVERFEDALRETLPEGISFEAQNAHTLVFFEEEGA